MCDAFANHFTHVEFWHPSRSDDYADNDKNIERSLNKIFEEYELSQKFYFRRLFSFDLPFLRFSFVRLWFYVQAISFSISCLIGLRKASQDSVVFIRDGVALAFVSFAKRMGLLKQSVFFEAHRFSSREEWLSRYIEGVVAINGKIRLMYECRWAHAVITEHDGVKREEIYRDQSTLPNEYKASRTILYAGNMFRWKGVYTLADAAKYLPSCCKLVFVGGSEDALPEFAAYVGSSERIEILGYRSRSEVMGLMRQADVLVLPNSARDVMSNYTSPLKLFEYMAARKPIVASRVSSLQEVLKDHENAVLFEADDSKDLADKIIWVIENDCSRIVDQAWCDVKGYTWDKRAERIVEWMSGRGCQIVLKKMPSSKGSL